MSAEGLREKAVRGAAWYGGTRLLIQLFSWVMTIAIARVLSPGDFGLLAMALVYTGLVEFLNELGLGAAIVQKKEIRDEDLDTLFWFGLGISAAIYGLTILVAPLIGAFFAQPQLAAILRVLGLMFLITNVRLVPWNLLTRAMDFKRRSLAETSGNLIGVILTLVLAYRGLGVWSLVIGMLTRETLVAVLVYHQTGWLPRARFTSLSLRQTLTFSLNLSGARVAWYIYDNSDRLLVGKFLGDQVLGYYTMAIRLTTELASRVLAIINQVAFPLYSRLQDDLERLKRYFLISIQMTCIVIFPLLAGLSLVSGDLVPLLFKEKWTPMVPAVNILSWAAMVIMIHSLAAPIVLARGQPSLLLRFNLLSLAILPAAFFVATKYGLTGVCLVWLLVFPLLALLWFSWAKKCIGFRWVEVWHAARPGSISTMAMTAVLILCEMTVLRPADPLLRMAIEIALGVVAYAGCLFVFFPQPLRQMHHALRFQKSTSTAATVQS